MDRQQFMKLLNQLFRVAADRFLESDDYREICEFLKISKVYYDMDLGDDNRYRNHRTKKLVVSGEERDGKIILYDNHEKTDLKLVYTYYYGDLEYVHAYVEFKEGVEKDDLDLDCYQFMSDIIYLLVSRQNMRDMLDFAETSDAQTGIPNSIYIQKKYTAMTKNISSEEFLVLYINLQNFKYINEIGSAKCGDEAIIQYARHLITLVDEEETVCRMGGDNFVMFIKKEHLDKMVKDLSCITIEHLKSAPNQSFEVSAWIGISEENPDNAKHFLTRLEEASLACNYGKAHSKKNVIVFSEDMRKEMSHGREIIAMFRPAVKNHEFHPFFQPKVDMHTGKLVGFEALCRWIHDGRFIYPDQFIPVLDREGLIHDLDMAIFRETCAAIRSWKDMGLTPPRVSSNFSRKNLFVPHIEEKMYQTIVEYGISTEDIEIEITETIKESEYNRLIDFVQKLKEHGMHISVDDFGTGYSSLSLIHNIDADVIKIDKSFVDKIPGDVKSEVLIESIISIAKRLNSSVIAEGVETAEQGRELMRLGCPYAQGYYYSKPVDFETATKLIQNPPFEAISLE